MCHMSSKSLIKRYSISRCDFRNFTKDVVTEAKYLKSVEK